MELKAYPFPEGMVIPRLMPFQEYPWNGDHFIAEEVLRLKEAHGLDAAIETGACLGSTSIWLAENFSNMNTIELNAQFAEIAMRRFERLEILNWGMHTGSSADLLGDIAKFYGARAFLFLDAHWNNHCPLLDELWAIGDAKVKPCILIHDFLVPGTDFGYDKMPEGRPFDMALVKPYLDRIYGEGGWKHNYPTEVAGARRGWISIEPANG